MKVKDVIIVIIILMFCWTFPYLLEGKSLDSVLDQLFFSIGFISVIGLIVFLVISAVNNWKK